MSRHEIISETNTNTVAERPVGARRRATMLIAGLSLAVSGALLGGCQDNKTTETTDPLPAPSSVASTETAQPAPSTGSDTQTETPAASAPAETSPADATPQPGETKEVDGITYVWTEAQGLGFYMPSDFAPSEKQSTETESVWFDPGKIRLGVSHVGLDASGDSSSCNPIEIMGAKKGEQCSLLPSDSRPLVDFFIYAQEPSRDEYTQINIHGNSSDVDAISEYFSNLNTAVVG